MAQYQFLNYQREKKKAVLSPPPSSPLHPPLLPFSAPSLRPSRPSPFNSILSSNFPRPSPLHRPTSSSLPPFAPALRLCLKLARWLILYYIIDRLCTPGMQNNSLQKQGQKWGERLQLDLCLPFSIKPSNFRKSHRYQRDGHWNEKERLKYAVFLGFFEGILSDPVRKKRMRVYEMMSDMIITRNSNQCRSHHQKMEKYRATIPEIISSVAEKYEPSIYAELSRKYLVLVKMLLDNIEKYKRAPDPAEAPLVKDEEQVREVEQVVEGGLPEGEGEKEGEKEDKRELQVGEEVVEVEKKEQKRTTDDYSGEECGDEDEPVMAIDLKEQQSLGGQYLMDQNPPLPLPAPQGFQLDRESRYFYEQQLLSLQLKKQWHSQNAQQLLSQWGSEMQSIKFCEQSIEMCKQVLGGP